MYEDLERPPLRGSALTRALTADGWRVEVVAELGSTNTELVRRARAGEPPGLVLVAERQSAGRGRLDRRWEAPARAGLTFSLLLAPQLPPARWPWLPLLAGLGMAQALQEQAGVTVGLKWPNDLLIGGRKVAGVLAEVPGPGLLVIGVGLNVTNRAEELPGEQATSLLLAGAATTDRDLLLRAVVRGLTGAVTGPQAAGDGPAEYRRRCLTLGTRVRVELPDGTAVTGTAEWVDDDGRLVVDGRAYGAGDVVHLRPSGAPH